MAKELVIPTKASGFDGYIDLVFQDENRNVEQRIEHVDVWLEYNSIQESLNEDEMKGTPFLTAVRRYVLAKHGVAISIWAAQDYYNALTNLLADSADFFTNPPSSLDSSTSTQEPSPNENA